MNTTEVQGESQQEDVASVLKYISEWENIPKSSNIGQHIKLLKKIFSTFGHKIDCQICGRKVYNKYHGKYVARSPALNNIHNDLKENERVVPDYLMPGIHKIIENGKDIWLFSENPNAHIPVPKIDVGVVVEDDPFLYDDDGHSWALRLNSYGLRLWYSGVYKTTNIDKAPKYVLMALLKSGRMPLFLQKIAEEFKKKRIDHVPIPKQSKLQQRVFTEEKVIECLGFGKELSLYNIRTELGCSKSTVSKLLAYLLEKDRVKRRNVSTENKPLYVYSLSTGKEKGDKVNAA